MTAALIDGNGGRYVEGAVMTSIPPYRIRVPLLLGGAGARELEPLLVGLGFDAKVASALRGQPVHFASDPVIAAADDGNRPRADNRDPYRDSYQRSRDPRSPSRPSDGRPWDPFWDWN